jgi:Ala-tRNA(Pro) deacylase
MNIADFLFEKTVEFDVIPHRDTYDAQRMAETVHVSGTEVAKTVLLCAEQAFKYFVAVLPANKRIHLGRVARELGGGEFRLATEAEIAVHCLDCDVGALPPFGSQYGMQTIVDDSLKADDEIVFEGNTHHESIRMKFKDFCNIEKPLIATFAR